MIDEYAIRCFLNGKRKFTRALSAKDAKNFLHTARHLCRYLEDKHELSPIPMPEVDETWTRADVLKLVRLLVKRAKIVQEIGTVEGQIAIADLRCASTLALLLTE